MYILYYQDFNKIDITVIGFYNDINIANNELIDYAKQYIIEEEGTKKANNSLKNSIDEINEDGLYLLSTNNKLQLIKRSTDKNINSGWFSNYEDININITYLRNYGVQYFDDKLVDHIKRMSYDKPIIKTPIITSNSPYTNSINLMQQFNFKPQKGTKFSLPKKPRQLKNNNSDNNNNFIN